MVCIHNNMQLLTCHVLEALLYGLLFVVAISKLVQLELAVILTCHHVHLPSCSLTIMFTVMALVCINM